MKKITLCVIKRHGKMEHYDERKVYLSVYASALNCEYGERKAKSLAANVSKRITALVKNSKKCWTSHHIRSHVTNMLKDKDVALMYKTHLDLS